MITRLFMLSLEARPPGAAVCEVRLEAIPSKPRVIQNGLFVPMAPEPEQLELTLARIAGIVGKDKVGSPELANVHARDRFEMKHFGSDFGLIERRPHGALRIFRPPLEATVRELEGVPAWIGFSGMHGDIAAASGPWRSSGEWWNGRQWMREEWDVAISSSLLRIYRTFKNERREPMVCGGNLRLSYIELHAASAFSFLDGASLPEALIDACHELEMPAMALLDRDGVYGSARFHQAGKKAGVRAHVGAEISMSSGCALPVLALNRTGYQNLCRLLTESKLRAPKGTATVSEEDLRPYSDGLVCLTGGEYGPLPHAIRTSGFEGGVRTAERLVEIFGTRSGLRRTSTALAAGRRSSKPASCRNRSKVTASRCSQPTACVIRRCRSARSSTSSPASAITARSKLPDACWLAMRSPV